MKIPSDRSHQPPVASPSPAAATVTVTVPRDEFHKCQPSGDAHLPDLIVSKFEPSTWFPHPGDDAVTFEVEVKNQGPTAAGPFNVQIDDYYEQQKQRVQDGLPPGATATLHLGPMYVDPQAGEGVGVTATADSDNEVQESNKCNNTSEITLWSPDPPKPDPLPGPPPPHR